MWVEPEPSRPSPLVTAFAPRIILGLAIVAFGALLLADNLGLVEARHVLRYFLPAILLLIGAACLAQKSVWGWAWIAAGSWLLAEALDWIDIGFWQLFFPLLLILVGGSLLARATPLRRATLRAADGEDRVRAFALMSGNVRKMDSASFRGGDLGAFMGGVELDLRGAKTPPEGAVIDAFVVWGGIEIKVPESWAVRGEVMPVMGALDDKTRPIADPAKIDGRLTIRGVAFMGGIEVKN